MSHCVTSKTETSAYYEEVLHGYLIQEHACRAYSRLLVGCKFVALMAFIIPMIMLNFNILTAQAIPLGSVGFLGLLGLIALGLYEKNYGKPVWRPSRAAGLGNWDFESKYSRPTFR